MKALILAAGIGSRLAPITDNCPKSMVPVNGKPILFQQIESLLNNNIKDITIIAGYKAEILQREVNTRFPGIRIIVSEDYQGTNNMYSAYLARQLFKNQQFLMMNADVFFDSSIINDLLAFPYGNVVATDFGNYIDESMKVVEFEGKLVSISKEVPAEQALGCSIDVYKFDVDGGNAFFTECVKFIEEKKQLKLWSEVALNAAFDLVPFKACPINGRWIEIDNHTDLAGAESLFGNV